MGNELIDASHMQQPLLNAILESVGEGILVVDENNNVVLANQRFAEMWRIPPKLMAAGDDERLLNFVLDQLTDPDAFIAKVKRLYGTEDEDSDTLMFKDGRSFERISRPLIKDGKLSGRVWSFIDVTPLRNTERELCQNQHRYRKLFQHSNDAIIVHTHHGQIVDANAKALQLLGFEKVGILRLNVRDLHPAEAVAQSRKAFEVLRDKGHVNFHITFKKKNCDVFHAVVSASMFEVGTEKLIQGIVRDFESSSKAEAEIARMNNLKSSQPSPVFR